MARHAQLTIYWHDFFEEGEPYHLRFRLNGAYVDFDGVDLDNNPDPLLNQFSNAEGLKALIDANWANDYTTTAFLEARNNPDLQDGDYIYNEVVITAKNYGAQYSFQYAGDANQDIPFQVRNVTEITNIGTSATVISDISDALCYNSATGSIVLTVSGGVAPYTYYWSDSPLNAPITTKDRLNIPAGNYTVTITDSDGVDTVKTFTVAQPTPIVITQLINNGDVDITVTGGTPPYTYEWSDGAVTPDREGLPPGQHSVQVTDSVGCSKIATYNIEYVTTTGFFFSKNPVAVGISAIDQENKENLTFLCDVFLEEIWQSENTVQIGVTQEQPGNELGETIFDVRDMLDAFLEAHLPAYNQANMTRADKMFKRFFVQFAEKSGNPPAVQPVQQQATNVVCCGGLSDEEYARKYFAETFIDAQKPFLTWEPQSKTVLKDQPEFLYFINWFDSTVNIAVKLKITYADGSEFVTTVFTKNGLIQYEVYIIPAGYAQLSVAGFQAKEVDFYEIWVDDQDGTAVSEIRTYRVAQKIYDHARYFLYENALGGFSTLAATGMASKSLSTEEQIVNKILPYDHAPEESNFEVSGKVGTTETKVPLGNDIDPDYNDRIQDFFMSERVYLMQNGRYRLVHIIARKVDLSDETENFTEKEFSYELQSFSRYTPDL